MAKKESRESKELVKVEPRKVLSPFEEMEHRFEEMFRRPFSLLGPSWFPRVKMPEMEEISPTVDIFEEGDDVVVKAELPGMKKEDIEVKLTETTITISGEKKKEEKVEKKNYYQWSGRTAPLPARSVCLRRSRPIRQRRSLPRGYSG